MPAAHTGRFGRSERHVETGRGCRALGGRHVGTVRYRDPIEVQRKFDALTAINVVRRQLLSGRQVATAHPAAGQMANFMYLTGDPATRKALVVDPAWDVESLLRIAREDGYEIAGALVTHYHQDQFLHFFLKGP